METPLYPKSQWIDGSPNEPVGRPSEEQSRELGLDGTADSKDFSSPASRNDDVPPPQGHQRLVFSDPVAFRYLEEDPATIVLDRRRRLQGYQIYVVEQWACSRVHPTFIIATYTGDASQSILVSILSVPIDESKWSSRMKVYFKAVSQFHARKKETHLGTLMVTNLSGFPSALTVIAVPDGDIKKHREDFIVNENLKRMGCTGRAGINVLYPQQSTIAKYYHLYHTSDNVPLYASVIEMVKLCQLALTIYGKLPPAYADGLLCDITEKAINDWWSDIGTNIYNIEPSDGILGPTTVAALLGLLVGAHNRLKAAGASVGKDMFDVASMKRAIGAFQKTQRLERTRRLDRSTIDRLHRATAKTAAGEGWGAAKAVKSTVAELSGKGGEMVMGIVGSREKANISEIETLDIERLSQVVVGPRLKWLWQGKPIKAGGADIFGVPQDALNGKVFSTDDQGGFMWTGKRDSIIDTKDSSRIDTAYDQVSHFGEGRSGFGRIGDALGFRSHHVRDGRDETVNDGSSDKKTIPSAVSPKDTFGHNNHVPNAAGKPATASHTTINLKQRPELLFNLALANPEQHLSQSSLHTMPTYSSSEGRSKRDPPTASDVTRGSAIEYRMQDTPLQRIRRELQSDEHQDFSADFHYHGPQSTYLRRSTSAIALRPLPKDNPRGNRLPRQLSFSSVQETLAGFEDSTPDEDESSTAKLKPADALAMQQAIERLTQAKSRRVFYLEEALTPYVENCVSNVEQLDQEAQDHVQQLNDLYYQRLDEYQTLAATSTDVVGDEKAGLADGLRKVEVLGQKLDYEVNALQSRVQEVEDGVDEFEKTVTEIERRVRDLVDDDGPVHVGWFFRVLNFFGKSSSSFM